jgi:transcriptional regulator with XRE-family HTH domain
MDTFSNRLNKALVSRNMKPSELARISGVNEGAISQYRKGQYKASQQNLEKLANALNVPIPWLMGADVASPFGVDASENPQIVTLGRLAKVASDEQLSQIINYTKFILQQDSKNTGKDNGLDEDL